MENLVEIDKFLEKFNLLRVNYKEIEIMKLWIGVYVKVFKEKGRRKAVKEKKRGEEKEKKLHNIQKQKNWKCLSKMR